MKLINLIAVLFSMPFLGLSFTACDDAKTKVEEQKHAPATAKAGTHEDWCEEHSVAESLCTRCHKELSAAFKATGDWCEDHGLPESQCKKCNPDLVITRPPKTAGSK